MSSSRSSYHMGSVITMHIDYEITNKHIKTVLSSGVKLAFAMATLIHQHQTGLQLNYSYYGNAAPTLIDGQFDGHGQIMHWLREQRAGGVIGVL